LGLALRVIGGSTGERNGELERVWDLSCVEGRNKVLQREKSIAGGAKMTQNKLSLHMKSPKCEEEEAKSKAKESLRSFRGVGS